MVDIVWALWLFYAVMGWWFFGFSFAVLLCEKRRAGVQELLAAILSGMLWPMLAAIIARHGLERLRK